MMVLDTNVFSELMKEEPDSNVVFWLNGQDSSVVYITALTVADIKYGIESLQAGKRKDSLEAAFNEILATMFFDKVLSFNAAAADVYGRITVHRTKAGRPMSVIDAQIASICLIHGAELATRNEKDFELTGLSTVNPWQGIA